jgi:hypothetical protein
MGRDETGTDELTSVGRCLFGRQFVGTFGCDEVPNITVNQSLIVNTQPTTSSGEHWLALYNNGGRLIGYDSFGRTIHEAVMESEPDSEQDVRESNCGQRCLAWLSVVYELGPEDALTV